MSGHDPVTTTLRGPHLARYVPPERPRTVHIDGRRITIGCSALEDGRWVPAISVDSAGEGEPRRIYTAGTRHAQPSPTAAMSLAHAMARDGLALAQRDPVALANWLAVAPQVEPRVEPGVEPGEQADAR